MSVEIRVAAEDLGRTLRVLQELVVGVNTDPPAAGPEAALIVDAAEADVKTLLDAHGVTVLASRPVQGQTPLLQVIFDALTERGWTIEDGIFIDPEGNRWGSVGAAVTAQTYREVGAKAP